MSSTKDLRISTEEIAEARRALRGVAWRTPLLPASRDEEHVFLKLECLQRTGSFKIRGAWNRMSRVDSPGLRRGFVTTSAGNHGQAVAWCARKLGARCVVHVPDNAVQRKVDSILSMGAEVVKKPHEEIMESMTDDRLQKLSMTYIHPFGDRQVMAGQGTVGLEVLEDMPDVRSVVVPVGGGGLINGIAFALKGRKPTISIYGVQAEGAAPLPKSLASGRAEDMGHPRTIADGIAATRVFDYMLPLFRENVDGVLTVSDEEIRYSMRHLASECHVVAEPAGAASLAAVRKYRERLQGPVVAVVSGGNCDPSLLSDAVLKSAP